MLRVPQMRLLRELSGERFSAADEVGRCADVRLPQRGIPKGAAPPLSRGGEGDFQGETRSKGFPLNASLVTFSAWRK